MKWCVKSGEKWLTTHGVGTLFVEKSGRKCFDTRDEAISNLRWCRKTFPDITFRLVTLSTLRERLLRALKRDVAHYRLKAEGESGWAQGFYMGRAHEARMLRKEFGE